MPYRKLNVLLLATVFMTITKIHAQTVKDADGNEYPVVKIGSQVWMAENLRSTKFNDGTPITYIKGENNWAALHGELNRPAYSWYNDDSKSYKDLHGALYNWWAVKTNKLCPTGWHVPTDEEWSILVNFLGGDTIAGAKLKSTSKADWLDPNTGATNETGFNAKGTGYHSFLGSYIYKGAVSYFWTSTEYDLHNSYFRLLYNDYANVLRSFLYNTSGFCVRCIQD